MYRFHCKTTKKSNSIPDDSCPWWKLPYVMFVEAVSGWNVLSENNCNKKNFFLLVSGWRSQHSRYILQNPKLYVMASFSSNHSLDLAKSLGPSRTVSNKMKSFLSGTPLNSLIHMWFWRQIKNINPTINRTIGSWFWILKI